jgi:hypothetical protein
MIALQNDSDIYIALDKFIESSLYTFVFEKM